MSSLLSSQLSPAPENVSEPQGDRTETDLRRATSDLYFSLVPQAMAKRWWKAFNVDPVLPIEKEAWRRMYRMPDHAHIEKQMQDDLLSKESPRRSSSLPTS